MTAAAGRHAADNRALHSRSYNDDDNGNGGMQVWQHAALSTGGTSDALRGELFHVAGSLIQHAQQAAIAVAAGDIDAVPAIDDRRRQKRTKHRHNLLLDYSETANADAGPVRDLKLVPVSAWQARFPSHIRTG